MSGLRRAIIRADTAEFASVCAELDPLAMRIMTRLLERVVELQDGGAEDAVLALLQDVEASLLSEPLTH